LAGSKIISVDQSNKEDRQLFQGAQKFFGIVITIGEAVAYVLSGMYGDVKDLGAGNAILIIMQLFFAGIVVIILVSHTHMRTRMAHIALCAMLDHNSCVDFITSADLPIHSRFLASFFAICL
jgi:hypothetical protein